MKEPMDLRGLVCPEPVLRAKKVLDQPESAGLSALVDDEVCVSNLERLSRSFGAGFTYKKTGEHYLVSIDKSGTAQPLDRQEISSVNNTTGTVVFINKDTFGSGDPDFSRTLLNMFLQTMYEAGHRPRAILLANAGVLLLAPDSQTLKVLNDFRQAGCEVLACGLCLEFYGLKEKIAVEQITNMFAICEYLHAAQKVISP